MGAAGSLYIFYANDAQGGAPGPLFSVLYSSELLCNGFESANTNGWAAVP